MPLAFSPARVGPLVSLVGMLFALLGLVLPLNGNEAQGIVGQGTVDLVMILVLLAALAGLSFSAAAFFWPHSPLLRGLGLLAASVGLLAQLDVLLTAALNTGVTLDNFPRLVSLLSQPGFLFSIFWLPMLGFLLGGWAITLGTRDGEHHLEVPLHRKPVSASRNTDPPARETQTRRRWGRKEPRFRELPAQESWWRIGRRQILAMIVGVLICSVLSNLSIFWEGPGETNFQTVSPAVVLAVFLGIAYGPWVGLVSGGMGSVLNALIGTLAHFPLWVLSNYGMLNSPPLDTARPPISWPLVVGSALVGFLAGLPLLGTPGRDRTVWSVLAVTIRSALAIVVGFVLMVVLAGVGQPAARPLVDIQGSLAGEALPTLLVGLLLLPLLFPFLPGGAGGRSEGKAFLEGAPGEPEEDSTSR